MHILLTDETNTQPGKDARFFAYGGVILTADSLGTLHAEIAAIRAANGYKAGDELKFDTNAAPHIPAEKSRAAKRQVIDLARRNGCKFIVQVVLHDIIKNQNMAQQVQWSADYVIGRFNGYLTEFNDTGIVMVDNLPGGGNWSYLSDKFAHGLTLSTGTKVPLDRIHMLAATCIGASYVASIVDVVLGAFRYCINNPKNPEAAKEMFGSVAGLMWGRKKPDGSFAVRNRGLIIRPEVADVKVEAYKKEYEKLLEHMAQLLRDAEPPATEPAAPGPVEPVPAGPVPAEPQS